MNKNNILIVTSTSFPFNSPGANLLRNFSTGLAQTDREVKVLLQYGQKHEVPENNHIKNVEFSYCHYGKRPNKTFKKLIATFYAIIYPPIYIIKKYKKDNIKCVVTYNNYGYESFWILLICKILNIKILHYQVDYYDWPWYKENVRNSIVRVQKYLSYSFRYYFLNRFNDGIFVISKLLKDHFEKLLGKNNKVIQILHLIDTKPYQEACTRQIFSNGNITIGAIGPLTYENGIDHLLESFAIIQKEFSNTRLILIGGPQDAIERYKKSADEKSIRNVKFTGRKNSTEIPEILNKCDILVLARPDNIHTAAGFPTKLGEYLASSRPVVLTRYGNMENYLNDKEHVTFADPGSVRSISNAIKGLIINQDNAKDLAKGGYKWVMSNLNYIDKTKEAAEFIDGIIEKK